MITNPGASRTLDTTNRSLVSVVGLHDKRLADAEFNLGQSLQDAKRTAVLNDQVSSGILSYNPFVFTAGTSEVTPLSFTVPAFDALVNGTVVTIGGNLSPTLTSNVVRLPAPVFWSFGSALPPAALFTVFIEFWYQRLNAATGLGYSVNASTGALSYYANGCVNSLTSNLIPNDTVDAFVGVPLSERVQLQWAIRVQPIDLTYDFTSFRFGLDPGLTTAQTVFGQANQTSPTQTSPYQFSNLGPITGDSGLWRSGDGNVSNALGSCDGYSYALPLAVVFQRNTGTYSVELNPFGTAASGVAVSGLVASGITGRFDGKYADVVFPADVVDTRSVVSLDGWNNHELLESGFVDVISGKTRSALARGVTPGNLPAAAGSLLDYVITVSPISGANSDNIGVFDGYRNGFSSSDRTFYTAQAVTVDQKTVGKVGSRWSVGDSFTVSLPAASPATIEFLQAQGLYTDPTLAVKTPVLFLSGQITVAGLGTQAVTVTLARNLIGTTYDPGLNPIYVTLGVEYPANGGMDLVNTPVSVPGGSLTDAASGLTLPVYGISDYQVQNSLPVLNSTAAYAYNPGYSNLIFGTRAQVSVPASAGVIAVTLSGISLTTFTLSRTSLNGNLTGIYAVSAVDSLSGLAYTIVSRSIQGTNCTVQIQGTVPATSTLVFTLLAMNTAQVSFNAPVKAVTAIEETIVAGTASDANFRPDPRVQVISVKNYSGDHNTVVLATTGGTLSGISGDDVNKLIWVQDTAGNYDAVQVASAVFANAFVTLNIPPTVNLEVQRFFVVASLLPAFPAASQLTLIESYIPYQGEASLNRDYEILHTEGTALITTNGAGASPVPGLKDVYPYNRELPIVTALPAQATWSDATLLNQPVASFFDSNFDTTSFENVEHTFEVPVHSNDFIEPIGDGKRKTFQVSTLSGGRGYAKAIPHMGFAIQPLTAKTVLGKGVTSTVSSVTLYVNNVSGNDSNDGLTVATAYLTIGAALLSLPSVLQHPCSIQLVPTGSSYQIAKLASSLQVVALGDGVIRAAKYYALGSLCFTIQESGRLVITALAGTSGNVTIDATGFNGFGDGPTSAFFIENSRAIFNQIEFKGFAGAAIKGIDADVEFVDCAFTNNQQAASFEQGSSVILDGGVLTLASGGTGFVVSQSDLTASGVTLATAAGAAPGAFFVAERGSSMTLEDHTTALETNITSAMVIAQAAINSSIVAENDFSSAGQAVLAANSVLSQSVSTNPFSGVTLDASSSVNTSLTGF